MNGFDNPHRDSETKVIKKSIGDGFKIKMDDIGNIFVKRYGKSNVYVNNSSMNSEESVVGADVMQMPNMALTAGTSSKVSVVGIYDKNTILWHFNFLAAF